MTSKKRQAAKPQKEKNLLKQEVETKAKEKYDLEETLRKELDEKLILSLSKKM